MPHIDDIRFDPAARREGQEQLRALPEHHLVEVVTAQKEESRKATQRQRAQWEEDWRLYQSEVDWSDKEEWQSQVWIPMPFSAVEQATSIIQRSMLDSPEFYGIEGVDRQDKLLATRVWKPLLDLAFAKTRFAAKFADSSKVGLACGIGLYFKFRWPSFKVPTLAGVEIDPQTGSLLPVFRTASRSFLSIETVPPWRCYRDPDSKPREQWSGTYFMQEEWVDRGFLRSGQDAGYYRNVEQVATGTGRQGPEAEARRKQQTWERHKFRKTYLATEWYGDIPDENGDPVYPDAMMIVVNDTLVFGPADTPLWAVDSNAGRRKWPYVGLSPLSHPMRFEGIGILRAVTPLAMLFSNIFNLYMDGLNWAINQPTEVDLSVLDDWDDLEHFPGKLWAKRGPGQALTPAQVGRMDSAAVLAALQYVHQMFENESFVSAFVTGLPGSRSQITKGEVQIKTAQSLGIFDGIARNLENAGTAAVELAADFLHQYLTDFSDPALATLVGPANAELLSSMGIAERMETLGGNFNYTFTGVSAAIHKADLLGRLMQAASLAGQGIYAGRTNPAEVLSAIFDALGVRDRIHVSEEPMVPVGAPPPVQPPTMRQLEPTVNELATGGAG